MKMLKNCMLILIFILISSGLLNCTLFPEDPAAHFIGIWRSKRLDNTDYQRLTINEDMTFVIEQYMEDAFVQLADGSWDYDADTSELTIFLDNLLSGGIYGPPTEGRPEKKIVYACVDNNRMLLSCLLGGNVQTGTGDWELVERNTIVGNGEQEAHIVLNLGQDGSLSFSITTYGTGPNESCEADYTFEGNQILITNSTDVNVLANTGYPYEIVDQGLYFSKLGDYYIYPFQREE